MVGPERVMEAVGQTDQAGPRRPWDFGFYSIRDWIHWKVLNKGMTGFGLNRIILAAE